MKSAIVSVVLVLSAAPVFAGQEPVANDPERQIRMRTEQVTERLEQQVEDMLSDKLEALNIGPEPAVSERRKLARQNSPAGAGLFFAEL